MNQNSYLVKRLSLIIRLLKQKYC